MWEHAAVVSPNQAAATASRPAHKRTVSPSRALRLHNLRRRPPSPHWPQHRFDASTKLRASRIAETCHSPEARRNFEESALGSKINVHSSPRPSNNSTGSPPIARQRARSRIRVSRKRHATGCAPEGSIRQDFRAPPPFGSPTLAPLAHPDSPRIFDGATQAPELSNNTASRASKRNSRFATDPSHRRDQCAANPAAESNHVAPMKRSIVASSPYATTESQPSSSAAVSSDRSRLQ